MTTPLQPGDRVRAGDRVYHSDHPTFHGKVTRVQTHINRNLKPTLKAIVEWDNGEFSVHPIDKLHRIAKETA